MSGERTLEGLEVRLRPRGIGRFLTAAFLSLWLCGWAAGEAFALFGVWMVAAPRLGLPASPVRVDMPAEPVAALMIGGFLLVWLALWTFGGVMAMRELLRSLWAEDRIVIRPDGLAITRRLGPFVRRWAIPRERVRRVALQPRTRALAIETDAGTLVASNLGRPAEREEALAAVRRELAIPGDAAAAAGDPVAEGLPDGWEEIVTPEGEPVLVASPRIRRRQAQGVAALALLAGVAAALVARNALADASRIPGAVLLAAATAALGWGAAWLWRGRMEWRLGSGRIVLRRRYGASVRDVFEARRLALTQRSDSDGDSWYALEARAAAGTLPALGRDGKLRRDVLRAVHDPAAPRRLGRWLAARADLPYEDLATAERRALELAQLRVQLEAVLPKTGPFARLARRLIERAGSSRTGR